MLDNQHPCSPPAVCIGNAKYWLVSRWKNYVALHLTFNKKHDYSARPQTAENARKYKNYSEISSVEQISKKYQNPFPKRSVEIKISQVLLTECKYRQGRPLLGILQTLATKQFEFRVIALESDFWIF